jgi:hypothetical protein
MTHNLFLAWSWFGHGQLTEMGLAFAISQFVNLRKMFLLKRLKKFEAVQSAIEADTLGSPGFPPTEKEVNKFLEDQEKHALCFATWTVMVRRSSDKANPAPIPTVSRSPTSNPRFNGKRLPVMVGCDRPDLKFVAQPEHMVARNEIIPKGPVDRHLSTGRKD